METFSSAFFFVILKFYFKETDFKFDLKEPGLNFYLKEPGF